MKKKLFVGNLSWKATEDSLKPVFEAFGKVVSIKIITGRAISHEGKVGSQPNHMYDTMSSCDQLVKTYWSVHTEPTKRQELQT